MRPVRFIPWVQWLRVGGAHEPRQQGEECNVDSDEGIVAQRSVSFPVKWDGWVMSELPLSINSWSTKKNL